MISIEELLKLMVNKGASDLHLKVPSPPVLRVDGELKVQEDLPGLSAEDIDQIFTSITTSHYKSIFEREQELDFSYSVAGIARFRVNVLRQRGTLSIAFRLVPIEVPNIDKLELPGILKRLVLKPRGLILVTGHTGSGKSTTLAAMLDYLNENAKRNVITIEDPVEFLHRDRKCIVCQRDVGEDTRSFAAALIRALRHDPDVLIVGEMRDLETISAAITAAETGHLVLGTLHTYNAPQSIDRIIDVFPPTQQSQIRVELSQIIEAVLSQVLIPRATGGRVAAFEIMIATTAIRNIIREGKIHLLHSVMQTASKDGMQTLDQALELLVRKEIISREDALGQSGDPEQLIKLLGYS
ncbi:MAG: type IV pili twitching motility protein PilT [Chloroflexi bacterium RBG_13_46_9]|nr:MAG: type IV pili twitching motility protein PilT [Chloroflexi bacterium RBG_13_46_9]